MACKDEKGRLRVAAGVGVTVDTLERMQALVNAGADAIVIDTAHGHSKGVIEKLREAKAHSPASTSLWVTLPPVLPPRCSLRTVPTP